MIQSMLNSAPLELLQSAPRARAMLQSTPLQKISVQSQDALAALLENMLH